MGKIYVLHENDEWTNHLIQRLEELELPYEAWHLDKGSVDLSSVPPEGVFYSRMSASSHTRGHRYAPELTQAVLSWLEAHGRTVINGSRVLHLEVSKVQQYLELQKFGIETPKTIAAVGDKELLKAAEEFAGKKFITKHNRAGKGLGVQLFDSAEALQEYVESDQFEEPVDGITLIQEYIESPDSSITRCEFVGGKFLYAVRVDTSEGFELCPADACSVEEARAGGRPKFQMRKRLNHPIIKKYERLLKANGIEIAGIEFIEDEDGRIYTYDINTNTNYNSDVEAKSGIYGMLEVAEFLGQKLQQTTERSQELPQSVLV